MKKIVLTGGGTAGHVTPHLALLPRLVEAGYEVHYIGTDKGMERELMAGQAGVTYHGIQSGKLRRYFDWKNLTDPFRVVAGAFQAFSLLGKIKPDIVFSKGGFVAVPVVMAAWMRRVPVLAHESDLSPGLANRISARFAGRVATAFPECAKALGEKGVYAGLPIRASLFEGDRQKGLILAGSNGDKPVLLVMGGSQGAKAVNDTLRQALPQILPLMDVLHLCGKGHLDASLAATRGYYQTEFLSEELPHALAAADYILSRAGATAICEFLALKKPMLLVPLPLGSSRGDQIENAKSLAGRGLAQVLPQEDMRPDSLTEALKRLMDSGESLRQALAEAPRADGSKAILTMIESMKRPSIKD